MKIGTLFNRRSPSVTPDAFAYLGETSDIREFSKSTIVVVLGQLIIMKIDEPPQESSHTYVPQPTRASQRSDFSLKALRHPATHVYCSIHPELAQHLERQDKRNGPRIVLAVDAMIRLARQQGRAGTLLICNGYEAPHETHFDTYLFSNGQLIQITESLIKPRTHVRFSVDVTQHLDEVLLDYPDARILWTAPLSPLQIPKYSLETFGPEIYNHAFAPVTHDGRTEPPSPKIPAAITAATIAVCLGAGAYDVTTLKSARNRYETLTNNLPSSTTLALEILQARANWQRETDVNTADKVLLPANRLLAAVADNPAWRVASLSLNTQRSNETANPPVQKSAETTPLSIIVSAPLQSNISLTDQAEPIVAELHNKTATQLIVRQRGIVSTPDTGRLNVTIDTEL